MRFGGRFAALVLLVPTVALAERPPGVCMEVGVDFTPTDQLQIVAWVEKQDGTFVDTIYMTQKTGRFGLGNRPGRSDFNTGSAMSDTFPYGRREQTFPVWAHRHGKTFPLVVFQDGNDHNLSHAFSQSSPEMPPPYCRPIQPTEAIFDSGSCASAAFTDKGVFSETEISRYPPRSDVKRRPEDSPSVDMYRAMNPFDAITRATPAGGVPATAVWSAPQSVDYGDYVLFVEASKTYDFNATYNTTTFPAPTQIPWADYGKPWRGQPSIVYSVPFSIAMTATAASTETYAGYGDPLGKSGTLSAPDATITTDTPGSGASRMQLVSAGPTMYRVRVRTMPEFDTTPPAVVSAPDVKDVAGTSATLVFGASGDDDMSGQVTGYDVRIRVGSPITAENFEDSEPITASITPAAPGQPQAAALTGLLPETEYFIGIRAYDNCFNQSEISVVKLITLDRDVAEVDWCFVATAAYGSAMATDVTLLRQFRDSLLRSTVLGELAIATYYTFGPAAAGLIGESELLRASVRGVLSPIIRWVRQLAY